MIKATTCATKQPHYNETACEPRRKFLLGTLGLIGGASMADAGFEADSSEVQNGGANEPTYQENDHVRTYYTLARF